MNDSGADADGLGALGEVGDARPDAGRTAGPVESRDVEIELHTAVLPDATDAQNMPAG